LTSSQDTIKIYIAFDASDKQIVLTSIVTAANYYKAPTVY